MSNIENNLNALGQKIINDAKSQVPTRSGALKRSLDYSTKVSSDDDFTLTLSELSYGQFVNSGTKNMKAQPFMDKAIKDNLDKGIDSIVNTITEDILSSLNKIKE